MEVKEKIYSILSIISYIITIISYIGIIITRKKPNASRYRIGFSILFIIGVIVIGIYLSYNIYTKYRS